VLNGDMSLVGPRPIVAAEIEKYSDRYDYYVQVLPGITGLWQVSGRNNTTYAERIDLDAYYVRNWSMWLDIYILACTVKVVILGEGAY
jgi:lipopolysaccharide/colanic/teichoic acid biosynthesis glycosyltransferase